MTTLNPQLDAQHSQEEELARLRTEVAEWRARFAASKTRDLGLREFRRRDPRALHAARRRG